MWLYLQLKIIRKMKQTFLVAIPAIAFVIGSYIIGSNYSYRYKNNEIITVTGLAEENFVSDLIVWDLNYSRKAMTIKEAYAALKKDEKNVLDYLNKNGILESEINVSAVNTDELYNYTNDGRQFLGYELSQRITIRSTDLEKVEVISKKVTELLDQDININSYSPSYYYTKLGDLKHDLLKRASEDGKKRAESIATSSGEKLKGLKKANMGIFQITGKDSNEDYSWGGTFNTSSKEKTASITVKMEFKID